MQFRIRNIEVLAHRNKMKKRCSIDWKNNDHKITNQVLRDMKCAPVPLKCCNLSLCNSIEKISEIHRKLNHPTAKELKNYEIPCREIEKLEYDYIEGYATTNEDPDIKNEWFQLRLYFVDTTYKYIEQVCSII